MRHKLPDPRNSFTRKFIALFAGALLMLSAPAFVSHAAHAAEKDLGRHGKWRANAYDESGGHVCNMWSEPGSHDEKGRPRGNIYAFVTHRPAEKRIGEVSFDMGYPLKSGSLVTVDIDGRSKFSLFTNKNYAFAYPGDDPKLVSAMRAGVKMTVKGVSARGTETKDIYDLSGFTAANAAINRECGIR